MAPADRPSKEASMFNHGNIVPPPENYSFPFLGNTARKTVASTALARTGPGTQIQAVLSLVSETHTPHLNKMADWQPFCCSIFQMVASSCGRLRWRNEQTRRRNLSLPFSANYAFAHFLNWQASRGSLREKNRQTFCCLKGQPKLGNSERRWLLICTLHLGTAGTRP